MADQEPETRSVKAINCSGREIQAGSACVVNGARGGAFTFGLASSATPLPKPTVVGVPLLKVDDEAPAFLTVYGMVSGIDTSPWPVDTVLYLGDQPGTLTSNCSPGALRVCTVAVQDSKDGSVFVDTEVTT